MSKLETIRNAVTSKVSRHILTVQKHSPTILFTAGVVGFGITVVLAARATLKLEEVIDEADHDLERIANAQHRGVYQQEADRRHDILVVKSRAALRIIKLYGPAALVGVASVAALTGSHYVLSNRLAGVTAAYTALERMFVKYRQRVVEEYGDEKDRELLYGTREREILEETAEGPVAKLIKEVDPAGGNQYSKFFDELCQDYEKNPEYNMMFLRGQQNYANDLLRARGHVFLNEVYDSIGVPRTQAGSVVGWVLGEGNNNYVDFGIFDANNERARAFVNGHERAILLNFNPDGLIFDKIGKKS